MAFCSERQAVTVATDPDDQRSYFSHDSSALSLLALKEVTFAGPGLSSFIESQREAGMRGIDRLCSELLPVEPGGALSAAPAAGPSDMLAQARETALKAIAVSACTASDAGTGARSSAQQSLCGEGSPLSSLAWCCWDLGLPLVAAVCLSCLV